MYAFRRKGRSVGLCRNCRCWWLRLRRLDDHAAWFWVKCTKSDGNQSAARGRSACLHRNIGRGRVMFDSYGLRRQVNNSTRRNDWQKRGGCSVGCLNPFGWRKGSRAREGVALHEVHGLNACNYNPPRPHGRGYAKSDLKVSFRIRRLTPKRFHLREAASVDKSKGKPLAASTQKAYFLFPIHR